MMGKNKYLVHYLDFLAEHTVRPLCDTATICSGTITIQNIGPCVPLNIVEDMVRHYFLNTSSKSASKGVNTELITKAIYNLMSEGCTGSIHFYKDGEVRIEVT